MDPWRLKRGRDFALAAALTALLALLLFPGAYYPVGCQALASCTDLLEMYTLEQITSWPDPGQESWADSITRHGEVIAIESEADLLGGNPDLHYEVYLYNVATGYLTQVTSDPAYESNGAAISADGNILVFCSTADLTGENPNHYYELFVVNSDGTNLRQLTYSTGYGADWAHLDADGELVAFRSREDFAGSNADHSWEIFLAATDGSWIRQLTDCSDPTYSSGEDCLSADGMRIAFTSNADLAGGNPDHSREVFAINADGTDLIQLTDNPDPAWECRTSRFGDCISENGQLIAFFANADLTGGNLRHTYEIFVVNSDGSGLRQLTEFGSNYTRWPSLSADGRRVAFNSAADPLGANPDGSSEVFVMNTDGTGLMQITHADDGTSGSVYAVMALDGAHIAFSSRSNLVGGNPDHGSEVFLASLGRPLVAESTQGVPGTPVVAPISLCNSDGVAGVQFDLVYDPGILTNAGAQKGALIAADPNWTLLHNIIEPGRMRVIAYHSQAEALGPGSGTIVECTFTVSPSAAEGQTSPLDIQNPVLSDSYGSGIPVVGVDGVFTVSAEYLVGDAFPALGDRNGDGDSDDCLEFGNDVIDWMDVISVYYCFIEVTCPQPGSARYDAMDSYPLDQVDGSCAVEVRGGDGMIDWMDVIVTYYRFIDDPPCKPRRPCGSP